MNVILILNDTFRRDYLGCYGNPWIKTPNLDRLAASSAVFDRAYIASHATLPARTDIFTGSYTFLRRGWSPLQPKDVILQEILAEHGYTSMFVFDTVPMGQDDGNFMRGFSGWEFVRGHHEDRWRTSPDILIQWPASPYKLKNLQRTVQYMRNKADWRGEQDYVTPRTFKTAIEWLERNHTRDGFLLWIDTLDPHEPFDPPPNYMRLYADPAYTGEQVIYPQYGRSTYMSEEEAKHVKALYAGEVTMVDQWIGKLLDMVEQLSLLDNTLIIHTSDHGYLFGEHDLQGKPGGVLGNLYEVTTRIPLIIRHPSGLGAGTRIPTIVQLPDLLPTILEFFGVPIPATVQGQSLWQLIARHTEKLHSHAFSGRFPQMLSETGEGWTSEKNISRDKGINPGDVAEAITVTDEEWSLICNPQGRLPELYNLKQDPKQKENVITDNPEVVRTMHRALLEFMRKFGAPQPMTDLYARNPETTVASKNLRWYENSDVLYAIQDSHGRAIAFQSRAEAQKVVASDTVALEAKTFGWIRARDPHTLIYVDGQYYWAEDLGRGRFVEPIRTY